MPIKIRTAALVIFSTISIQASLTGIYLNLRSDIKDLSSQQSTQNQLNNMRFQTIEGKQSEDHEWMRNLAHRVNAIEQEEGIKTLEQVQDKGHK